VDGDHPEFSNRFDKENSCPNYLKAVEENHGTNVASLLAAEADNGICSVGIAPGVTLSACSMMFGEQNFEEKEGAVMLYNIEVVDVSSNSWGPLRKLGPISASLDSSIVLVAYPLDLTECCGFVRRKLTM
jgi:furin